MNINRILCIFNKHKWVEESHFDSDWGGIKNAYYCKTCGLIKQETFNNTYYVNLYYVEWFAYTAHQGIHIEYDALISPSKKDIIKTRPQNAYTKWFMAEKFPLGYYHYIVKVKPEHLKLNDNQLSDIYSYNSNRINGDTTNAKSRTD
jgi:hypothetical protein